MKKPNVLFILADDLGWGDVSYHGSEISTPNIDRLAYNGVELDQHYVCPLCTPTRVSLLTGRHPGRFGKHATVPTNEAVLPDGYYTLASMFKEAGYATGLFGKWHLGSDPVFYPGKYGFDYSYGSLAGGVDPYKHRYKEGPYSHTWHRNGKLVEEKGHATDLITEEAINWIKKQKNSWFCYVPFTAVHTPIRAPEEWIDIYWNQKYDTDPERDRSFKMYAGYTSHMDYSIGRLIETLKCLNQLEDTIVIFTSDNGAVTYNPSNDTAKYPGKHYDMPRIGSNYPFRGHKAQLYEGGIRTPGIISWFGHLDKGKIEEPLHITDWMPTLASIIDINPDNPDWDGINLYSLLSNEKDSLDKRVIYWNLKHERFALRYGDWKLIKRENKDNSEVELFNINNNPFEEHKNEMSSSHPKIVKQLSEMLEEQRKLDDSSCRK